MSILSIDSSSILHVEYDSLNPLPDETYVLASPDLIEWDVTFSGSTGEVSVASGSAGTPQRLSVFDPNGKEWEITIANTGILSYAQFEKSLVFSPVANEQFKIGGVIAAGYGLYVFETDGFTHAATYKSPSFIQVQPHPIILNSQGFPTDPIFLELGHRYIIALGPPAGTPITWIWFHVSAGESLNRSTPLQFFETPVIAEFLSVNSIVVAGDQRTTFQAGRRVAINSGGMVYGMILTSTFDGLSTTLVLIMDAGVALLDTLTQVSAAMLQAVKSATPDRSVTGIRTKLSGSLVVPPAAGFNLMPAGILAQYFGAGVPNGWLLCDGSSYLRSAHLNLFTAIGIFYGAVDPTHFNVPDLRGRFPLGLDSMGDGVPVGRVTSASLDGGNATSIGRAGGEETHVTTTPESAPHAHGFPNGTAFIGLEGSGGDQGWLGSNNAHLRGSLLSTGGGLPHNNMPPWQVTDYLIYAQE